jgi:hypothetical protein
MPFVDVRLSDIELEKPSPLGLGTYVFQLLPGAEYRKNKFNDIEELNVSAAVAEGDQSGRRIFFTYPDPTVLSSKGKSLAWSAQALKKLEIALGTDALPGEDSATYLNRVASSAAARFTGTIAPSKYIREGETDPRPEFNIFSVAPAA